MVCSLESNTFICRLLLLHLEVVIICTLLNGRTKVCSANSSMSPGARSSVRCWVVATLRLAVGRLPVIRHRLSSSGPARRPRSSFGPSRCPVTNIGLRDIPAGILGLRDAPAEILGLRDAPARILGL